METSTFPSSVPLCDCVFIHLLLCFHLSLCVPLWPGSTYRGGIDFCCNQYANTVEEVHSSLSGYSSNQMQFTDDFYFQNTAWSAVNEKWVLNVTKANVALSHKTQNTHTNTHTFPPPKRKLFTIYGHVGAFPYANKKTMHKQSCLKSERSIKGSNLALK